MEPATPAGSGLGLRLRGCNTCRWWLRVGGVEAFTAMQSEENVASGREATGAETGEGTGEGTGEDKKKLVSIRLY